MSVQHTNSRHDASDEPRRRPIVCGADVELANFLMGVDRGGQTGAIASRALLREVHGFSQSSTSTWEGRSPPNRQQWLAHNGDSWPVNTAGSAHGENAQDWGRKFLPSNGGCVYIDLDHLELCLPEVTNAFDWVAAWHAMLRIAREALDAVNRKAPTGVRVQVLVNNSDGLGHSYGGHLNFLLSRRTWDNIFHRKPHYMLFLMAHQVSSIVYTGQGKVGSENGREQAPFQITQRADFDETLVGEQTTHRRPIVNSRDEPLCGRSPRFGPADTSGRDLARLHVIFYDSTLCPVACLLKVGVLQIIAAMLEAEQIVPDLLLDDPLQALIRWGHDPDLKTCVRMAAGQHLTAVEHQLKLCEAAHAFYERGDCDGLVPHAKAILQLWSDTLLKLHQRDFDSLAGRLDWVLKRRALERALAQRPGLTWASPQIKHLDHLFSSLDETDGLYWAYERAGLVEQVVSSADVERLVHEPPHDTRAWSRAHLLRLAGPDRVDHVDWDQIRFRMPGPRGWPSFPTVQLADPLGATKADTSHLFEPARPLEDVIEAFEADQEMDRFAAGSASATGPDAVLWLPQFNDRHSLETDPLTDAETDWLSMDV